MGDEEANRGSTRYGAIDGLRGLAAAVVVIHHCFLVSPSLSLAVARVDTEHIEPWVWWMTFTPLHLLWSGTEAVYVFFILSGFVLTLPFVGGSQLQPTWLAYYAKRFIRIYLPVWASLAIALLLAWIAPRTGSPDLSGWLLIHDESPNVFSDGLLIGGADALNSPLWSLQWEMLFSITLPLYVALALRIRNAWLPCLLTLFSLIALGTVTYLPAIVYMSMFGVGVLLALRRDSLEQFGRTLSRVKWGGLIASSLLLLSSRWLFPQLPTVICMACIGGALLVIAFIACPPIAGAGNHRLLQWLGTRSFSLYLVHEPIVVSIGFVSHISNPWLLTALAIPPSLGATELFFRFAERPGHLLAGRVGRLVASKIGRSPQLLTARP
ncbi:acyltransferase [Pseudarthrobacter sp. Fe7]|nr:acyltransferase [Pseudarthrobacter sp. Fe7]